MTRAIHQLVHTLSYGDAISTEVLAMRRVLRELGFESEIFSIHEHPNLKGQSIPFAKLTERGEADVILHYSLGSPLNQVYAGWNRGKRVLIYHNITPPKWYASINQRVADDINVGLQELPNLCRISDSIWADSRYNADEIVALGCKVDVLELLIDPARWDQVRNEGLFSSVVNSPGTQVLHVGRMAPNKCIEDVIKSFYFLVKYLDPDARLRLVGIDTDTELYSFALRELASYLGIGRSVEFVGPLSDAEVRSLYEASDVYLCMSEHEGFCLPIIEAMNFGLPVIAYAAGAVPDTVGNGGILVYEKKHAEIGQLIARVAANSDLRQRLINAGRERISEFSFTRFKHRISELIDSLKVMPISVKGV